MRQQLDAIQHNQGKTGEEVYRMQAVKLPLKESSSSPDQEVKDWLETGMHQAAREQMSTDSPSEKTEGSVATVQKNEMQD